METYIKRSAITGRTYDYFSKDIVRILNMPQAFYYIEEKDIIPLDIVLSSDRNNPSKKLIVFIFSKEETHDAYISWINRESEENGKD